MRVRYEAAGNDHDSHHPVRDARPVEDEPYANVYDVFGFLLQLLQMGPIISACLVSLVANSCVARVLTVVFLSIGWLGARHLAAQHQRGRQDRQAGQAARGGESPAPEFPEVWVVHRIRVSTRQHIAHCSCRAHACPQPGGAGAVAHVRRVQEQVRP